LCIAVIVLTMQAETRRTYRAVLSEPVVVFPGAPGLAPVAASDGLALDVPAPVAIPPPGLRVESQTPAAALPPDDSPAVAPPASAGRKRPLDDDVPEDVPSAETSRAPALSLAPTGLLAEGESRKKKRKKGKAPPDAGQA
jgi:ribonuclease P/MRP protein subunit RPP1